MKAHSTHGIDAKLASVLDAARAVLRERLRARGVRPEAAHQALGEAVRMVSLAYRREQGTLAGLIRDREALDARLAFFLPRDLPKLVLPLRELDAAGALPRRDALRILDIGAGLGTSGLGAAAYLLGKELAARVQIDAIDVDDEALEIAERLARELVARHGFAIELSTRLQTVEQLLRDSSPGRYDLILLGLMLNEVEGVDGAAALGALSKRLSSDGALTVIEPALRDTSRALQRTRDAIVAAGHAPYVFAPCLHGRPCPLLERERDWCHERMQQALPSDAAALARAAGLRDEDLTFSYLTLRNEPGSLAALEPSRDHVALYRVVGGPLISKGKRELLTCGTDHARLLRRLDRNAQAPNAAFDHARRGSVVAVEAGEIAGAASGPGAASSARAIGAETNVRIVHEGG